MSNYWDELKLLAVKASIAGGVAAIGAVSLGGEPLGYSVPYFGLSLPSPVAVGLGVAGGSVGAELAHKYIFPNIPGNEKYANLESTALNVVASGGISAFLLAANGGNRDAYMNAFLLGAGSTLIADQISPDISNLIGY